MRSCLRVADHLADEEPVVEDVVVRERRALREARRAGRVLDVDRVVEGRARPRAPPAHRVQPSFRATNAPHSGADQLDRARSPGSSGRTSDHRAVIDILDPGAHTSSDCADWRSTNSSSCGGGGVDVHEDRPDLRGRVLGDVPLGAVRRPDADPVAALHTVGEERQRDALDPVREPSGRRGGCPRGTTTTRVAFAEIGDAGRPSASPIVCPRSGSVPAPWA